MTVPADLKTNDSFTSDGSATVTVPLRIQTKASIQVYVAGIKREETTYSVASITVDDFSITFSPAPDSGEEVVILQRYPVEREADFVNGQTLTTAGYNDYQDNLVIMLKDLEGQINNFTLRYAPQYVNKIIPAMLELPVPTGTGIRALSWNGDNDRWEFDVNSADQVLVDLSANSSAATSGATLVGFWDGNEGTTVQEGAVSAYTLGISMSAQVSGASLVGYWDGNVGTTVQEGTVSSYALSKVNGAEDTGANLVGFWDGNSATDLQNGVMSAYTLATAEGAKRTGYDRDGTTVTLEKELNLIRNRLAALETGCTCPDLADACIIGTPHWTNKPDGYGPVTVTFSDTDPANPTFEIGGFGTFNVGQAFVQVGSATFLPNWDNGTVTFSKSDTFMNEGSTTTVVIFHDGYDWGVEFVLRA